jgi:hypothetical protein
MLARKMSNQFATRRQRWRNPQQAVFLHKKEGCNCVRAYSARQEWMKFLSYPRQGHDLVKLGLNSFRPRFFYAGKYKLNFVSRTNRPASV